MTVRSVLTALVALLAACALARAGEPVDLSSQRIAAGLDYPVFLTAPAGDTERLFVLEQNSGHIKIIKDDAVLAAPFLDIGDKIVNFGERGLLCMAFSPLFDFNGVFFILYNDLIGDSIIERYTVSAEDPDLADLASARLILTVPQPFGQHNANMIAFGPHDGMFYVGSGDGGAPSDPFGNAQSLETLLGKILRIDVSSSPYGIPADNPFLDRPEAAPEIWAYGLRNPWRFSFDSATGDMYIADVGFHDLEEVDVLPVGMPAGANLGWNCKEGTRCTAFATCTCPDPTLTEPVHQYNHNDGCAIIGGYVYRGSDIPELQGTYFFGDHCQSRVWSFRYVNGQKTEFTERTAELSPAGGNLGIISSFGVDGRGELYTVGHNGDIYRIAKGPDCDGDGLTDLQEIAAGAPDVNHNGLPDSCELLLDVVDGIPDQSGEAGLIGAAAGQPVALFFSTRGLGPGPGLFGDTLHLDILPPVTLLACLPADANGTVSFDLPVLPPGATPTYQAVIVAGSNSKKSNPVQKVVQP